MKNTTLCFLHTATDILLAMKKRRFGMGKLNGVGGKLLDGETLEQALVREISEEIGVSVNEESLEKVAVLDFTFVDKPDWNQQVHVYFTSEWEGDPSESEEMTPEWHSKDNLPFENMWEDDRHWLPKVLAGERVRGKFVFDENGKIMDGFTMEPLLE